MDKILLFINAEPNGDVGKKKPHLTFSFQIIDILIIDLPIFTSSVPYYIFRVVDTESLLIKS